MKDLEDRIDTAIAFLNDGLPFRIDILSFGMDEKGFLNISSLSNYDYIENITRQIGMNELNEIKGIFYEMVNLSPSLKRFIENKKLKFTLEYNYGMGNTIICSEIDGDFKWYIR